ncbi:MAG: hypothetical protein M1830_003278 [Pleopsidium flavum]|nr:MAG: hypothetical protein M1830_003278 [Pleopsidium flavum]
MSMRKRLGLCFALGLGFCATVIAVYKCTKIPTLLNHSDYTYATMELFIWTSIEANAIIIAACLPTLRPLYRCLMGKSYTSDDASNQTNGRSSYFMNSLQNTQSKQRSKKPPKEDTNNFATIDNASEERILSRNRIHQTFDVNINYEQRRERSGSDIISDMKHPGAETIYAGDRV